LNIHYKGAYKTLIASENAINKLIKIFIKKIYEDYNFSYSRAIAYYVSTHEIKKLANNKTMKDIYNEYKNYLKNKNIKLKELEYRPDLDEGLYKIEKNINTEN